jgi:uncharacterized protein (TIGR00288 family)
MDDRESRIALLIDADNASATKIEEILEAVKRHGSVEVRRAYGDWESSNLKRWKSKLTEHEIEGIQQSAHTPRKNATDMRMVIGAMDLLGEGSIDAFALVSSDADFTPLVTRLREAGHQVYGFGEKKTPRPFRDSCTKFTLVDPSVKRSTQLKQLVARAPSAIKATSRANTQQLSADTRLLESLLTAVIANKAKSGWANLSRVRNQLAEESSFDQRSYGFRRFGAFMVATEVFEIRRVGAGMQVRVKPSQ